MIVINFKTAEDAAKVDLTRLGTVTGGTRDRLTFSVELDLAEWIDAAFEANPTRAPAPVPTVVVAVGIITATLAACGVWPESIET